MYTPPVFGQPVASSADTRDRGMKNIIASSIQKNADENPSGAIPGQARRLSMAETLIIVSRKTPRTLRCAGLSHDFDTEATGITVLSHCMLDIVKFGCFDMSALRRRHSKESQSA